MTGPEHYREAERLLAAARHDGPDGPAYIRPENVAAAQVHATLALAAATRDAGLPPGKVLADRCRTAQSAHGRQCGKADGHRGDHDFGDGGDA